MPHCRSPGVDYLFSPYSRGNVERYAEIVRPYRPPGDTGEDPGGFRHRQLVPRQVYRPALPTVGLGEDLQGEGTDVLDTDLLQRPLSQDARSGLVRMSPPGSEHTGIPATAPAH